MNPFYKVKFFKQEPKPETYEDKAYVSSAYDAIEIESLGIGAAMPQDVTGFSFGVDMGTTVHYA